MFADSSKTTPPGEAWWLAALTLVLGLIRAWRLGDWPLTAAEVELLRGQGGWLQEQLTAWLPPVVALRIVPFSVGVVTPPLLYGVARLACGGRVALVLVLLLGFSPLHLRLSTTAGAGALATLLVAGGVLWLLAARQSGRAIYQVVGTLALVLATLAEPLSGCIVVAVAVGSLIRRAPHLGTAGRIGGTVLLVAGGLAVWTSLSAAVPPLQTEAGALRALHEVGLAIPLLAVLGSAYAGSHGRALVLGAWLGVLLLLGVGLRTTVSAAQWAPTCALLLVLAAIGLGQLLAACRRLPFAQLALVGLGLVAPVPGLLSHFVDNSRFDVPRVGRKLSQLQVPGEPVFANGAALVRHYSALPCAELPATEAELRAALPTEGRAYVALLLQRGRAVGGIEAEVQDFVESNMSLLVHSAPRRRDLYRYETRLYQWSPP